jgi:HlyD family secretion protein
MKHPAENDAGRPDPWKLIRRLQLIGYGAIVLLLGTAGLWAATATLQGAVIAAGTFVVESNVKKVQHPTGGIVKEIRVAEGDRVEEGEIVMRLDDTVTRATLGMVQSQLDELLSREARLESERDDSDHVAFPGELMARKDDPHVQSAMAGEAKLFESRRRARIGQISQLEARIAQSNEEIRGLDAQQQAKEKEIKLIGEELAGVRELYEKNLVSLNRLMQLQRDQTRLGGERGQLIAENARVHGRINELELQIIQVGRDASTDVLKDMRETQAKIAELQDRRIAAQDQLSRTDIRAPQSGFVYELSTHTIGGVIQQGATIMEIVPKADHLIVEAKVAPQDVDQIAVGGPAVIEVMAGDRRTMPEINGELIYISPDLIKAAASPGQPPQPAHYLIRIAISQGEIARLGDFKLVPGMSAEVFIQTAARTPLQYLLKPLREQVARTFRER